MLNDASINNCKKVYKGTESMIANDILKHIWLFHLQNEKKVIVRKALENEVIMRSFKRDDQSEKVYLVVSGRVLIQVQRTLGGKDFYSLISKNQLFGIEMLLNESQRPREVYYNVIAQTNVEYLEIESQFLEDYLYLNPEIAVYFLSDIIIQFMQQAQVFQLMNESVVVRVANTLVELIDILDLPVNNKGTITFPTTITQEFIANYTNASIGRTSAVFNNFEKNKIIKRFPIQIIDLKNLKNLRDSN